MRKEDVISTIVYLILVAAGLIVFTTVVRDAFTKFGGSNEQNLLLGIIALATGIIINVVGLELLHALGAKIGGYEVVSINIVGFCFEKVSEKWSFKFSDFDGLTGETIIAPKKEKRNLKWYVWMPLLGYAVEVIGGILFYTLIDNGNIRGANIGWLAILSLIYVIIGSLIALYNIVPLRLDSMTDGYRLVLISKPVNIEAFDELMRIENLKRKGEKVGKIKVFDEITEFSASINLLSIYENLNNKEYDKANKLVDKMLENNKALDDITSNRLLAQKLYILLMEDNTKEAREFYNKKFNDNMRRFIASDTSMESLRAYALIAGILDESESEVEYTKSKLANSLKKTQKSKAEIEEKLFKEAIEKISKIHPDWFKDKNAA